MSATQAGRSKSAGHAAVFLTGSRTPVPNPGYGTGLLLPFELTEAPGCEFAIRSTHPPALLAASEWCGRVWQSATVSVLQLLAVLAEHGLTLGSVRPEFMGLLGGRNPLYFRPTSIIRADPSAGIRAAAQVADFFLLPVYMCAAGHSTTLRDLLARGDSLAPVRAFPEMARSARLACASIRTPAAQQYLALAEHAANLPLPNADTFWSQYYRHELPLVRSEAWPYKNHAAERILATMEPSSMVDLASNTGWYALLAAAKGIPAVAMETDEICVNRLFDVSCDRAVNVVPVMGDITNPFALAAPRASERLSAECRFASDLAVALAITHHLVISPPWLSFADVAALLAGYSKRYLLTEFVGFDPASKNPYRVEELPGGDSWYKIENFMDALRRRFREVVLVPGPKGRRLVLAEK
ncbi:MAG TPA: hypothetical protein VN690_00095 [Terriglobales bacterium]|nr:hypothetical protein [Terriglobales bacterium]